MNGKNEVAVMQRTPLVPALTPDQEERRVCPSADVYETGEGYLVLVDLPGATRDAVTLWADRDRLVVMAVVEPHRRPGDRLLVAEWGAPVYHRSFTIGDGVDRASIEARFENGVLAVKLMKKEEQKPRAIPVR